MTNHVYKTVEITGSSPQGTDEAVRIAIAKASESLHSVHWFQVVDTRGYVEDGQVAYWQVTLKVGFRLDD